MTIEQEIPFTNDALKIYIDEIDKRMDYLNKFVSEYRKLKFRRKVAENRIKNRSV